MDKNKVDSKVSLEMFNTLMHRELPIARMMKITAVSIDRQYAVLRASCSEEALRPGGTISGPVMMGLADAALYGVVLANIGHIALAVTTNLSINFLRKPGPGDLYCKASILKLGKRLAVCEATLYTTEMGEDKAVAHVTGTYSIPPESTSENPR